MFEVKTIIPGSGQTQIIVSGIHVPSGTNTTVITSGSQIVTVNPWGITKNN